MSSKNDKLYTNLVSILKLFKNRPTHLAKYLIDNDAFNQAFIDRIINSEKLDQMNNNVPVKAVYFVDITDMSEYLNSFLEETKSTKVDLVKELNDKLDKYIKEEKYEDAIRIRDYMEKNGIKRLGN